MNELRRMIEAADRAAGSVFLATVVDVDGSAYRRPGARMLILERGERIGSISGGCLERVLCRPASQVTRDGPRVVSFDTRADADEPNPRYNVGCSGIIHVLVEAVTGDERCPLRPLRAVVETGQSRTVATVYGVDGPSFPAIGTRFDESELCDRFDLMREHVRRVTESGRSLCCELIHGRQSCRLLLTRIDPPRPLLIFGAGDDAQPLSAMASQLGWDVTVVDTRPEAYHAARQLELHPRTAAVLMTHSFADDAELLPWLLNSDAGYVGLLGPKSRTARLMRHLHERGRLPTQEQLDRLHSPVGLDLGASTPAGIALSILAEIIADDNTRDGGRLQDRRGPIHAPASHVVVDVRCAMKA